MLKTRRPWPGSWLPLAALALAACIGYRTPLSDSGVREPRGDAGIPPPRVDARVDSARDQSKADRQPLPRCTPGDPYVLVLGTDHWLYHLDPGTLSLSRLASVACGNDTLNSMTTSPVGPAYISNQSGELCIVDPATFASSATRFDPGSIGGSPFGMALLADNSPAGQTLYIASSDAVFKNRLSHIDITTFALGEVGPILPVVPWAELTAGPDGGLYGFAIGETSSLLLNIDPRTGSAIDVTSVPAGYTAAAFGLVYWQGDFYLFVGPSAQVIIPTLAPAAKAEVYRYRKGDTLVAHVGTLDVGVIGAGVAACR